MSLQLFDLILATALVSIVLSPTLVRVAPVVAGCKELVPVLGARFAAGTLETPSEPAEPYRVVIAGYGRVGRELAQALDDYHIPYLVVEHHPDIVRALQRRGTPVLYGDAGNATVLEHARLRDANLFAILVPDPLSAEMATATARRLNPSLDILARAAGEFQAQRLRDAGATDVVQPEFEAGVSVVAHALRAEGLSGPDLARVVMGRKAQFYHRAGKTPR